MNPKQFSKIGTKHILMGSINLSISYSKSEFNDELKKISLYENAFVYKSSISGLGESTLIKNEIKKRI